MQVGMKMIPEIVDRRSDLAALCRHYRVSRLEVFGSAASGSFRAGDSDIDFLVEFEAADAGYTDRYFRLLESLEQLLGRQVDLVVASAIKNPYFRDSVARSKALLYAA